jgi:prefoldin subunit 5
MDYAISVLNKRIEEINLEVKRLKSITEFELSSDIEFIKTELENFKKQKDELVTVITMLYNKRK